MKTKHLENFSKLHSTEHTFMTCINKSRFFSSGFRRDVDEIYALVQYYAASSGNPLPTFPDNQSVPNATVKKSKETS
jgi:hypothetical protein